ncbi:MAG: hypothetical protein IKX23_04150 [Treponema sp.]|nr:hypothetical protein [Treponema sp.]
MKKYLLFTSFFLFISTILNANPFNSNLTNDENEMLNKGEVLIKNIDYQKYMCLNPEFNETTKKITADVKSLSPKYLAEIIQIKSYKGNEDLPQKLEALLNNISDYAGIPYWSERHQKYFDLYESAKIVKTSKTDNITTIDADLIMEPFGLLQEQISVKSTKDELLYKAFNTNNLKYSGITCVSKQKMQIYIYVFRDNDKWILYGVGGVNAPHIPFMTDRIRTSFINRIKTFCNFIFKKI